MELWKSLAGMMDVELTSAETEAALTAINAIEIEIWKLRQRDDLTCCFRISRKDYPKLEKLCKKRGESLKISRKKGIYWLFSDLRKRPVFMAGMVLLAALVLYLPSRVYFVRVEGNRYIPERQIIAAAEECGICFGASRREVRSEKVKNALLEVVPELQWAGVNTSGCVAIISVREGTEAKPEEEEKKVASIVAVRDGYILSGTVVRGTSLFQPGQTVKAGQVLISGYTDCGICIQATRAEGEVMAQTNHALTAVTPASCVERGEVQYEKRKYSLLIGKKRINLWKDSGISDITCGRMYEEYYFTLPGGFQLPIALCIEKYTFYEAKPAEVTRQEAEKAMSQFAECYLTQEMVAGQIQSRTETVSKEDGCYRLNGSYICTEMIGRVQLEQIGEING